MAPIIPIIIIMTYRHTFLFDVLNYNCIIFQSNRSGRRSTISLNESFTDSRDSSRPNTPAYNTEIAELRAKLLKYEDEMLVSFFACSFRYDFFFVF